MIVSQVNGTYETKVPCLNRYSKKVKGLLRNFNHFELERTLWLENNHANALAQLASIKASNGNQSVIQSIMLAPSIKAYLKSETLHEDKRQAMKIKK